MILMPSLNNALQSGSANATSLSQTDIQNIWQYVMTNGKTAEVNVVKTERNARLGYQSSN